MDLWGRRWRTWMERVKLNQVTPGSTRTGETTQRSADLQRVSSSWKSSNRKDAELQVTLSRDGNISSLTQPLECVIGPGEQNHPQRQRAR